jgi:hypothetical protein
MSIFPELDIEIDLTDTIVTTDTLPPLGKVFLFNFDTNQYVLKDGKLVECTEIQAIMQWASLCVRTYIDKYKVYIGTGFGINAEDIIGHKTNLDDFYTIELEREIKEGLTKNPRIIDVINVVFTQENNKLNTAFTMELYNNELVPQEVTI